MKFRIYSILLIGLFIWQKSISQDAGTTPDLLDVSLTGAATYSVPLSVPPGIRDVLPKVSLDYNSQAGNGLAGHGWNIGGLSTITRVGSTTFHDGEIDGVDFDDKDRFALDGQRLLLKSGTYGRNGSVYQTESYSNLKIRAIGTSAYGSAYGPSYFIVHYPDGSRGYYGRSTATGRLEWALDRWQDPQGNFISYTYDKSNELLRIANIYYGSRSGTSAPNRIRFFYATRGRAEQSYFAGRTFSRTKILSRIEVFGGGKLFRKYQLSHTTTSLGYQRMSWIQESNGDNKTLPKINFTYGTTTDDLKRRSIAMSNIADNIDSLNTRTLSGDFDGDERMDLVFYDIRNRNKLRAFNNLNGTQTEANPGWDAQLGRMDYIFTRTALDQQNKLMSKTAITTVSDTYISGITSSVGFSTYSMNTNETFTRESYKTWEAPVYRAERLCNDDYRLRTSKRFVTGDFNGDGITDVIALTGPYTETFCNPVNCDDDDPDDPDPPQPIADINDPNAAQCCRCTDYVRNRSQSYFIDLDRRKTSNFSNYSGLIQRAISYDDPIFAADFNGDGVSEMIHMTNGRIEVYGLNESKILTLIYSLQDSAINKNRPFLPGDYNGDGKMDFAVALQSGSSNWRFFLSNGVAFVSRTLDIGLVYRPTVYSSVLEDENYYIAKDFDGDGKTDILRHFVALSVDGANNRDLERFLLYTNDGWSGGFPLFDKTIDETYYNTNKKRYGIPLFLDANERSTSLEYAYISNQKISAYEFTKDHREDTQLQKIVNNGIETTIEYSNLFGNDVFTSSAYYNDNSEVYPYVNNNNLRGFKVVANLERKASGIVQKQDFKYEGAVSHAQGLGFLGFKQLYRSNWYGNGVTQLWNNSRYSPQLRGALTLQWATNSFGRQPTDTYISKTSYAYNTSTLSNKVFLNVPTQITIDDKLKGFISTKTITYTSNYNPLKSTSTSPDGRIVSDYTYFNNLSSNDQNYHVGRPKSKKVRTTINGNTFYQEEAFTYGNNLVKTLKNRGQGTDWVTETFDRDVFGNTLKKTLSAPGMTSRSESFTYDTGGRFLLTMKDFEGLTTTFTYDTDKGNLLSTKDPYNLTSSSTYDGWNRAITQTDYLGKITTISYTATADGGMEIFTNPDQSSDSRETYNGFGWLTQASSLALNGKWVVQRYTYDSAGRQTRNYEPYFSTSSPSKFSTTGYDEYGRVVSQVLYTGETHSISYDELSVTVDDGTKEVTTVTDTFGNVVTSTDPGGTINYSYHGNGTMKTTSYAGQVTSTEIDNWGRQTKLIDPSAGTYTYKYNLYGETIEETTPKGTTTYTLDAVGKLTKKTIKGDETDMVLNFGYHGTDKLLRTINTTDNDSNRSYNYTYDYDSYKRPKSVIEVNPFARFENQVTYDGFGRPLRETYLAKNLGDGTESNITVRNVYDNNSGILEEIRNDSPDTRLWRMTAHNARGQITRTVLGNSYQQNRDFDVYGLPTTIRDVKGTGSTQQRALRMDYSFDAERGTLQDRKNLDLDWEEAFQYDALDRLTTISGSVDKTHRYDNQGRITRNSSIGEYGYGSNKIYQLASLDLNEDGSDYFQKRQRVNVLYNAFKKPLEVTEEGKGRVTFGYSPLMNRSHAWYGGNEEELEDRRFRKHYSAISPIEIVEDRDTGETKIISYIDGDQYSSTVVHIKTKNNSVNGYHYIHRDYLGSILAITNSAGSVVERTQFGAWGKVDRHLKNGSEAEFGYSSLLGRGYTGHEHFPSVGLIHMNGRMYDAQIGRFLSPDNYIQNPYNTQNYDRYGYVLNNPLIFTDPTGEQTEGDGNWGYYAASFAVGSIVANWGPISEWVGNAASSVDGWFRNERSRFNRLLGNLFGGGKKSYELQVTSRSLSPNLPAASGSSIPSLFTGGGSSGLDGLWQKYNEFQMGSIAGLYRGGASTVEFVQSLGTWQGWKNMGQGVLDLAEMATFTPNGLDLWGQLGSSAGSFLSRIPSMSAFEFSYYGGYASEKVIEGVLLTRGVGLVKNAISGTRATTVISNTALKALPSSGRIVKHHIFNVFRGNSPRSQVYRDFFKKHNIDLNSHTVHIPEGLHKLIHGAGNNWTTRWKRWIDANPNASTRDVYQQAGRMMDEYGLSGYPILPY